jgi:hypothetical protein
MMQQLKFSYPRRGLVGSFNTFRLGLAPSRNLKPGEQVELVAARTGKHLGYATVQSLHTGSLDTMASAHAALAHNWKDHPAEQRAELLKGSMKKRYPPGRCADDSAVTVIYLEAS